MQATARSLNDAYMFTRGTLHLRHTRNPDRCLFKLVVSGEQSSQKSSKPEAIDKQAPLSVRQLCHPLMLVISIFSSFLGLTAGITDKGYLNLQHIIFQIQYLITLLQIRLELVQLFINLCLIKKSKKIEIAQVLLIRRK